MRGTYLKFEPEESGCLLVYILQNGMTDNAYGDDEAKLTKNGPWLRRRALYIVDETGKAVNIDENSGWESTYNWDSYLNSGTTNADRFPGSGSTGDTGYHNWCLNYFCDGITRCAWNYDSSDATKHLAIWEELTDEEKAKLTADEKKDGKKYSWLNAYDRNHNGKLDDGDEKRTSRTTMTRSRTGGRLIPILTIRLSKIVHPAQRTQVHSSTQSLRVLWRPSSFPTAVSYCRQRVTCATHSKFVPERFIMSL